MKRYKLVRIINGKYFSANTKDNPIRYEVGEIAKNRNLGIACYKTVKSTVARDHINETRYSFNNGNPIAILEVEPIGKQAYRDIRYGKNGCYEGGINYESVRVLSVVRVIDNGV